MNSLQRTVDALSRLCRQIDAGAGPVSTGVLHGTTAIPTTNNQQPSCIYKPTCANNCVFCHAYTSSIVPNQTMHDPATPYQRRDILSQMQPEERMSPIGREIAHEMAEVLRGYRG